MCESRPAIPPEIKLKVRQKCKFQCVICGCPVYDYDHLIDWSLVKEHTAENIFLLCPTHHRMKTSGRLSKDLILEKFSSLHTVHTTPEELFVKDYKIILGNNEFYTQNGDIFNFLNKDFFRIQLLRGEFFINSKIYNSEGKIAFKIENNEYIHYTDIWDINNIGNKTIFRNRRNDVFLEVSIDCENKTIKILGKFYVDSNNFFWFKDSGIFYNRICLVRNCKSFGASKCGLLVTQYENQIGSGIGFYNCSNNNDGKSYNDRISFAWSLDRLVTQSS